MILKILEYGEAAGLKGTTWPLFEKWAADTGLVDTAVESDKDGLQRTALQTIFSECFEETGAADVFILKPAYHLRLAELRERQKEKQAGVKANRNAVIACLLAMLAIAISAGLGFGRMNAPVTLHPDDLAAIVASNREKDIREVKLTRLQMAQILSALERARSAPLQPQKVRKPVLPPPSTEDSMLDAINRYYEQE